MSYFSKPVTPAVLSPELRALCNALVPDGEPLYVDVKPLADAREDDCFPLVQQQVRSFGGQSVIGWSLWEFPTLFFEAEFHCVWRQADGNLVDVAPKRADCARVFFLPDGRRHYEGMQVNNIRRPLRQEPALLAYFASFDSEFDLLNRGARAQEHGEITLEGAEAIEHHEIIDKREAAFFELAPLFPKIGPYHPCPCGSGRKVKWCHKEITNAA